MNNEIKLRSYTLYDHENNSWLAQVVLSTDGFYGSVTDYGNFSFAWRHYGPVNFREFLLSLGVSYFATKMAQGFAYTLTHKKIDQAAERYAKKVLPALQAALREEIEKGIEW